jgi:hypothetical protein
MYLNPKKGNLVALIMLISLLIAYRSYGQSTQKDSTVVAIKDMITVVEKLDECEEIKDYNKTLEKKIEICDEFVRTSKASIIDMNSFIAKSNETIFAQDSVIMTLKTQKQNMIGQIKFQNGQTIKNSLAFGVGGLTIGFGIGVLLGIFAK